jgi:pimeloyl-ACP methyl ester carboxylesterase
MQLGPLGPRRLATWSAPSITADGPYEAAEHRGDSVPVPWPAAAARPCRGRRQGGDCLQLPLVVTLPRARAEPGGDLDPVEGCPVLLLINGFQSQAAWYRPFAARLATWGFAVLQVRWRGACCAPRGPGTSERRCCAACRGCWLLGRPAPPAPTAALPGPGTRAAPARPAAPAPPQYTTPPLRIISDADELSFLPALLAWARSSSATPGHFCHGCLDVGALCVAGHSRGGKLAALHFACSPELVRAAFLIDPVDNTRCGGLLLLLLLLLLHHGAQRAALRPRAQAAGAPRSRAGWACL